MTAREKFTRALRDGRILRNAKGHIVIPEVVKPGVILDRNQGGKPMTRERLCFHCGEDDPVRIHPLHTNRPLSQCDACGGIVNTPEEASDNG